MLDGYVSEKEQIESIRKWWNENGKYIAIAVVIGLAIGFGWRYWHKLETRRAENASVIYQTILQADTQNNFTTVQGGAKILMNDFTSSPYASLAALLLAKENVVQNKLSDALTQLHWVIHNGSEKRLKQIARLNTARILLSQNNPQAAASELKIVDDKNFEPLINWVQGDIETQKGNTTKAQAHYQKAKNGLAGYPPATDLLNQLLAQPAK